MAQLEGQAIYASVTSPQKDVQMVPLKADSSGEMLYAGSYRHPDQHRVVPSAAR